MATSDTIVAVATPKGVGGVAVLRLSGADAMPLALRFLSVDRLLPRHAHFARFGVGEAFVDEVLATYFPAPHSYTGEEMVEVSCHGSRYVQEAILQAFIEAGARLAEAGEFTRRAFLHGKMDLSQAEAVADLIDSVTPQQHRLAVSQLRGGYAEKLKALRQQLLDLTSLLELELDFSQEDVEFADRTHLRQLLSTLHSQLSTLIASFRMGNALKQGIPVAIVGEPNVGKSTLLNALLQDDRAIVSDIPGTTRDTVEGMMTIDGIAFRLVDTAGLRETSDAVEQLGIERSLRAMDEAMVVIHVLLADDGEEAAEDGKKHIKVLNKCDLPNAPHPLTPLEISALTGQGLGELKRRLVEAVSDRTADEVLLTNARHCEALQHVQQALTQVEKGMDDGLPTDLLAVDLRDALYHLGTITGEVTSNELLSNIFGRFCIGK